MQCDRTGKERKRLLMEPNVAKPCFLIITCEGLNANCIEKLFFFDANIGVVFKYRAVVVEVQNTAFIKPWLRHILPG